MMGGLHDALNKLAWKIHPDPAKFSTQVDCLIRDHSLSSIYWWILYQFSSMFVTQLFAWTIAGLDSRHARTDSLIDLVNRSPFWCLYHFLIARTVLHLSSSSVGSRSVVVSKACLQVSVTCAQLCQLVSFRHLLRLFLHYLAGLPLHVFLSYGLQVVTHEVHHRSSLRRLTCSAQDHLIFLTLLIMSITFFLSLTQMLVFLSLYVMLSILLSILVCAAASLFCACLVSVQFSAP